MQKAHTHHTECLMTAHQHHGKKKGKAWWQTISGKQHIRDMINKYMCVCVCVSMYTNVCMHACSFYCIS